MSNPEEHALESDDFDASFEADFDAAELDSNFDEPSTGSRRSQAAWQRLDDRREAAWLREQLEDWDDWDDERDLDFH